MSNAIEKNVERDLKALLDAALILGADGNVITVYPSRQKGSFTCPSVTVYALPAPDDRLYGAQASNVPGGYYMTAIIFTVATQKDDDETANEYHSIISQVRDTILVDDIIDQLNTLSTDFTVYALSTDPPRLPPDSPIRDYDLGFTLIMVPTADATPAPGWRGVLNPNVATTWDAVVQAAFTTSTTTSTTTGA